MPPFAILSHCWEDEEVTFGDCASDAVKSQKGYAKIFQTCSQAVLVPIHPCSQPGGPKLIKAQQGIQYVWIDTCCIDKSSSAELSQAINSMFAWYRNAKICYVFLADALGTESIGDSRWFRRGWTLQELIAPKDIIFFDKTWVKIGTKNDRLSELSEITSVSCEVLRHESPLSSICVAQRLAWAANRDTTRVEDRAYCLLGILEIHMPPLYGEGEKAFYRLQEEIVRSTYDLSILAWSPTEPQDHEHCGFFAKSPQDFSGCSKMNFTPGASLDETEMSMSNKGLIVRAPELAFPVQGRRFCQYSLKLNCREARFQRGSLFIAMRKIAPDVFVRTRWWSTKSFKPKTGTFGEKSLRQFVLLTKIPNTQVPASIVSSSRFSQVEIRLPEWVGQGKPRHVIPRRAWDDQDHAFIGNATTPLNWGALSLDRDIFFLCHWSGGMGSLYNFKGYLLDYNNQEERQLWEHMFLYGEMPDRAGRPTLSMLEFFENDERRDTEFKTPQRRVSFQYHLANDSNICVGPRWIVEIR